MDMYVGRAQLDSDTGRVIVYNENVKEDSVIVLTGVARSVSYPCMMINQN